MEQSIENGDCANGCCFADIHSQTADLWIIDKEGYVPEYNEQQYSPEYLLLHEMLHIPLAYFSGEDFDSSDYYSLKNIKREQFINRMARTLLGLWNAKEGRSAAKEGRSAN